MSGQPKLTARFDEALRFASDLHRSQVRKASGVPYIGHLLSVSALVIEENSWLVDELERVLDTLEGLINDEQV